MLTKAFIEIKDSNVFVIHDYLSIYAGHLEIPYNPLPKKPMIGGWYGGPPPLKKPKTNFKIDVSKNGIPYTLNQQDIDLINLLVSYDKTVLELAQHLMEQHIAWLESKKVIHKGYVRQKDPSFNILNPSDIKFLESLSDRHKLNIRTREMIDKLVNDIQDRTDEIVDEYLAEYRKLFENKKLLDF